MLDAIWTGAGEHNTAQIRVVAQFATPGWSERNQ